MTDLNRLYSDDVSSSQSEDFNKAHAEEDPTKIHDDDNEDSSFSSHDKGSSAKQKENMEAEKTKKSIFLKPWTGVLKKMEEGRF